MSWRAATSRSSWSEEYRGRGPFAALNAWLDENLRRYGFYRPYTRRGRGVQPEPWHVSYAPVAKPALARMSVRLLADAVTRRGHRRGGSDPRAPGVDPRALPAGRGRAAAHALALGPAQVALTATLGAP